MRRWLLPALVLLLALGEQQGPAGALAAPPARTQAAVVLLRDGFARADGLVTNEYAYWNPRSAAALHSPVWELTSGSLFARGGAGWSGAPDGASPDATSSNGTGSAVFRLTTKHAGFGDVTVGFRLRNLRLVATGRTAAVAWDGVHVLLRYRSQAELYAVSVNRRDHTAVIKKKLPGGPTNGGTYHTLAATAHRVPYGAWQRVAAAALTNPDGSVTITLRAGGQELLRATDRGVGGPPITRPGKVGLRGDNCEFQFDDLTISRTRSPPSPRHPGRVLHRTR